MEEIWKDITGFEGTHQISNYGNIRSLDRTVIRTNGNPYHAVDKILRISTHPKGYKTITLQRGGKAIRKALKVHRLVAEAFISNPNSLPQVNHKDGDKSNNYEGNLEWVSNRENCTHKFFHKEKSSKYPGLCFDKSRQKWVVMVQIKGIQRNFGRFESEHEAYLKRLSILAEYGIENKYAKVA